MFSEYEDGIVVVMSQCPAEGLKFVTLREVLLLVIRYCSKEENCDL